MNLTIASQQPLSTEALSHSTPWKDQDLAKCLENYHIQAEANPGAEWISEWITLAEDVLLLAHQPRFCQEITVSCQDTGSQVWGYLRNWDTNQGQKGWAESRDKLGQEARRSIQEWHLGTSQAGSGVRKQVKKPTKQSWIKLNFAAQIPPAQGFIWGGSRGSADPDWPLY